MVSVLLTSSPTSLIYLSLSLFGVPQNSGVWSRSLNHCFGRQYHTFSVKLLLAGSILEHRPGSPSRLPWQWLFMFFQHPGDPQRSRFLGPFSYPEIISKWEPHWDLLFRQPSYPGQVGWVPQNGSFSEVWSRPPGSFFLTTVSHFSCLIVPC